MAEITEIRKMAKQLNLQNLARGEIDLNNEALSNLDYLAYILGSELELRKVAAMQRRSRASRLPLKEYDKSKMEGGLAWHVEQLETMQWVKEEQNLILIGRCDTGKTSIAAHLGRIAIDSAETVYYCNIEEFLRVIKNKDRSDKTMRIYKYITECSVIIIDDVMYANILPEDLPVFYRAISFLNEARSLVIITNRELSAWVDAAEDTHLMQTLVDRITANSQIMRL